MKRYLIRGGLVYDGSGAAPEKRDVLIEGGRIAAVGVDLAAADAELVGAAGKAVAPGFIDMHRHCDVAPLRDPDFGDLETAQGITTAIAGNCGLAPVPIDPRRERESLDFIEPIVGRVAPEHAFRDYRSYAQALGASAPAVNVGFLAGSGAIKTAVRGFSEGPYAPAELEKAAGFVAEAMDAGAFGLSLGIMYQPECWSSAAELAVVAAPAAARGGVLTAHIRGEGDSLVQSIGEVLGIARTAGLRLHISHLKATGIRNWRTAIYRAIEAIEEARTRGEAVTADFYPYTGGATTLLSLLPPSLLEGGAAAALKKLGAPGGAELLRKELGRPHAGWDNMAESIGWDRILVSSANLAAHAGYGGKSIAALASEAGGADPVDFVHGLLLSEEGKVGIVVLSMDPADVDAVARLPYTAVISDSLYGGGSNPHPRLYGAFARTLREHVRERGVLSLEEAVRKMSSLPADILGLRDRGRVREGFAADLCVFDPGAVADRAEYADSRRLSTGMDWVFVNGEPVVREGGRTRARPGELARRRSSGASDIRQLQK